VDVTGSGSCPVAGLEHLNSATRELKRLSLNNFTKTEQHALHLCVTGGVTVSIARSPNTLNWRSSLVSGSEGVVQALRAPPNRVRQPPKIYKCLYLHIGDYITELLIRHRKET
jgi:hypothetical protein